MVELLVFFPFILLMFAVTIFPFFDIPHMLAKWKRPQKKKRKKDDRPAWERLADAYEKAAERLLDDAVNSAEAGYPGSSRRSLEEANDFMAEAKRIKQQALEDMMEGKIL